MIIGCPWHQPINDLYIHLNMYARQSELTAYSRCCMCHLLWSEHKGKTHKMPQVKIVDAFTCTLCMCHFKKTYNLRPMANDTTTWCCICSLGSPFYIR